MENSVSNCLEMKIEYVGICVVFTTRYDRGDSIRKSSEMIFFPWKYFYSRLSASFNPKFCLNAKS